VDWDYITLETANSSYGVMCSTPSHTFTQTFQANSTGAVIRKRGTVEHMTKVNLLVPVGS
jgi:hypothetical protein